MCVPNEYRQIVSEAGLMAQPSRELSAERSGGKVRLGRGHSTAGANVISTVIEVENNSQDSE